MPTPRQVKWIRAGAVVVLIVAALLIGRATGLGAWLTREHIRGAVALAGGWGPVLYIGAFTLGMLVQLPASGILFVAVAVTVYGDVPGTLLAYVGSFIGVIVSFFVVRGVGGRPLAQIENRTVRRLLDKLEARPIITVIVLRLLFFAGAPVNYGLALSAIRLRDYLIGSAIGLLPPAIVLATAVDLISR